jgi:hypothetical protein
MYIHMHYISYGFPGHIVYITTGAMVPEGAQGVVKIEDTSAVGIYLSLLVHIIYIVNSFYFPFVAIYESKHRHHYQVVWTLMYTFT